MQDGFRKPERRFESEDNSVEKPLRLIYVVGTYPSLTVTFIDREINILRRSGVDLQVMAVRRQTADIPLSANQRALQESVIYLLPANWSSVIISQLYFAILHPGRYFRTLFYLLTRPHPRGKARYLTPRFMTFLHFIEGVYAAHLLRRRQFEELHAHFVDRAATIVLVASRLLEKPYSLSIHAGPDIFVNPVLLREKILGARHVATCTLYNKSYVEAIIGQDLSGKISHIHHGLDLALYHPGSPVPNGQPLILSVGQLTERKGFVPLIKGCRALRDQGHNFTCQIVGQGPQRQELEILIKQLALEDTVTLCGALRHEEVIKKYSQATMFVLPCIMSKIGNLDGIPNVLAEAMAMQVPVISTNISGIPELVKDQVNGLLTAPGDNAALVNAMAQLLNDPALRERLGQNGRQAVVEKFDVERNVRQFAATLWPDWFQGLQPSRATSLNPS
ncbi:MAG: glycosyltransferase family 4 protein [Chloroflexota bacterium]|nr:glycosyltransferase family 4 protein [Chloroflexota bacterium]